MNRLIPYIVVLIILAGGSPTAQRPAVWTVRVAAASDLRFAFDELVIRLQKQQPSVRIEPVYGSSGNFHAQLGQRAPFDLYLSADIEYPRDLVRRGLAAERDLFAYAVGTLVVWVPASSALPIERDGLRALTGARRIAIANPRHAPYGRAAEAALRQAGLWDAVQGRLVLGDNVAQTAQFVESGAADAALLAKSIAAAPAMRGKGRSRDVTTGDPALLQGGVVLPWARSREGALAVRDFLLGSEGRQLLQAHGFALPD